MRARCRKGNMQERRREIRIATHRAISESRNERGTRARRSSCSRKLIEKRRIAKDKIESVAA